MIYLDYAATTPLDDEVYESYTKLLKNYYANSSSLHQMGIKANSFLESSRESISKIINVKKEEVIFVSSATEANNLAILGYVKFLKDKTKKLITSKVEHPSVLNVFKKLESEGYNVKYVDVLSDGRVDLEMLENLIDDDTYLVSIMLVNNEVGAINDLKAISELCKKHHVTFHSDVTQGVGKLKIDFSLVDLASFSSHKLYAPKGSGVLVKKKNIKISPLIYGGGQEFDLRSGTSNWPNNVAFAKALRLSYENMDSRYEHVSKLWDILNAELSKNDLIVINSFKGNSPYIFNFSIKVLTSQVVMSALEERGFCISTTSACGSKAKKGSHVIKSMLNNDELSLNSLRVSLSHLVSEKEILLFIKAINEILEKGRK